VENNYGRTSGALSLFYNWGRHPINDGYTVVPISQLILPQPYTIDHTGRQFPAETGA